ncbi:MAG: VWA domain-containing protein [Deltaproteobacteria bacterium]|nr:VWA domain-containing protein [Deltaproteobacteria bacterium]
MNQWQRMLILILVVVSNLMTMGGVFGAETEDDKTLSPYFWVKSDTGETDQLPLKSTSAEVDISGVIADVTVSQVYKNEGKNALEAIYVFPASTRAAVYGMKMTIGERTIVAKIRKKEEARAEYEQAKKTGRTASLLEQQRPNTFQMNVANILPGDVIKVELKYTELLSPTDAVYEFVYPTVVGPRYSNQPAGTAPASEKWISNPYLPQDEKPQYTFDFRMQITAGLPLADITCTSHKVKIDYTDRKTAAIKLDPVASSGGNRDVIIKYRLAEDKIESGLLLSEEGGEKFFLLMMQPPKKVATQQITPREYIFIVDVSGSMHGFPLEISKKLLKDLLGGLRSTDVFNVILFSGGSAVMSDHSQPATPENIQRADNLIGQQAGGGGTELLPALKRALALPRTDSYARTVVIATDGYVTVEEEVFDLIRNNLGQANMFTFGIGTAVNRHLIEGMARVGLGEPFVITKPQEAPEKAARFRQLIASPVLTGIKVRFPGFEVYDVEPAGIPDVLAERPVMVFGKWRHLPQGKVELSGQAAAGHFEQTIEVGGAKMLKANASLRYLWARHKISLLSDYNKLRVDDKRVKEVTELGLKYNLLTAYTSFVAVDDQVRRQGDQVVEVRQPLPLPEGVSNYAVGGTAKGHGLGVPAPALAPVGAPKMKKAKAETRDTAALHPEVTGKESAATARQVTVSVGSIITGPGLSEKAIRAEMEKQIQVVCGCLKTQPINPSGQKSELIVTLSIDPQGGVEKVEIGSNWKKFVSSQQCLIDVMKKMHFIPRPGGQTVQVTITLVFS